MFCPKCGEKIELKDTLYCHMCGFKLDELLRTRDSKDEKELDEAKLKRSSTVDNSTEESNESTIRFESATDESKYEIHSQEEEFSKPLPKSLTESSIYNMSRWEKLKDKWGWGWLFFAFLFYSSTTEKYYLSNTEYGQAIQLFGFILCMILYYFFRQKFSRKIERSWLRSATAVVLAYIIFLLVGILLGKLLTSNSGTLKISESDWSYRTLSAAGLTINSPFDFAQSSVEIPEEAKDLNQNVQQYNYQSNSFVVTINFVQYQAGTTILLDNYAPRMAWFLNKSNSFSDFRYSETKITKDSSQGRIVNGSMKSEGNVVNLLAVVLSHDTKLWYVICFFDTTSANKLIAQRIINSVSIIQDKNHEGNR